MATCLSCASKLGNGQLSLGKIPIGNQFRNSLAAPLECLDLTLTQCPRCRLVQLENIPKHELLIPRHAWISYREPEGHLDDFVSEIFDLGEFKTVAGIGPFEKPMLSRFDARGCTISDIDLGVANGPTEGPHPYLETWQALLQSEAVLNKAFAGRRFDLVSMRYLLEHSSAPKQSLRNLAAHLNPGGCLIIEVPDSAKFLARHDYCFPWEEHTCYFVEETLLNLCQKSGYRIVSFKRYSGDLEDALIALITPSEHTAKTRIPTDLFTAYADGFKSASLNVRREIEAIAANEPHNVALFGMGHQAIMFANAMGITDLVATVVDDEPNKAGLYPPGFRSRIVTSETLLSMDNLRLCLLAISPRSEPAVRRRLAPLIERGVTLSSIYSGVGGSIYGS